MFHKAVEIKMNTNSSLCTFILCIPSSLQLLLKEMRLIHSEKTKTKNKKTLSLAQPKPLALSFHPAALLSVLLQDLWPHLHLLVTTLTLQCQASINTQASDLLYCS